MQVTLDDGNNYTINHNYNMSYNTSKYLLLKSSDLTNDNISTIMGGGSSKIYNRLPGILNQFNASSYFQLKYLGTDLDNQSNKRVIRIVWDGRPILINSDVNVYIQDIIIDIFSDEYTRQAINDNVRRNIYIPITLITRYKNIVGDYQNYYKTDNSSWKGKFVIAYDLKNETNITRLSLQPENINMSQGSVKVNLNALWENLNDLKILSQNNKKMRQIINWDSNKISNYLVKVNVTQNINMEVIKLSEIELDLDTDNLEDVISDSDYTFNF